jgi:hypothetical protein
MRPDLPADIAENLRRLPPDLREAAEKAIDATLVTPETEAHARREREKQLRKEDAEVQRELAWKVERALEGEWGDDVRRAVDQIVREVKPSVLVLADWAKRHRRREQLTRIEWLTARLAFESAAVRYALAAAKKVIAPAERERKAGRP